MKLRKSNRSSLRRIACAVLIPLGLAGATAGCLSRTCNDVQCLGGFIVNIDGGEDMGERLESATYRVSAMADGGTFEVECTFDDEGEGTCDPGQWLTEPGNDIDASVDLWGPTTNDPMGGQTIVLRLSTTDRSRFADEVSGPDEVEVVVERADVEIAQESYSPEYDVIEDFAGEGCGDCGSAPAVDIHAVS